MSKSDHPSGESMPVSQIVRGMLAALTVGACAELSVTNDNGVLTERFLQAVKAEFGNDTRVRKWTKPVRIRIVNDGPERYGKEAEAWAERLRAVSGHDITVTSGDDANMIVFIVGSKEFDPFQKYANVTTRLFTQTELASIKDRLYDRYQRELCVYFIYWNNHGIYRSFLTVPSRSGDGDARRCIQEEMTQALGLRNDQVLGSAFLDASRAIEAFSPQDELFLKVLYDRRLGPSQTQEEARPIVRAILDELNPPSKGEAKKPAAGY